MPDPTELDTTIPRPDVEAGEGELLRFALVRARAQFAWKVGGLDDAGLHHAHPPSTTTLAGLVKHLAQVEDRVVARFVTGRPLGPPWDAVPAGEPVWEWAYRTAADDTAEHLYRLWQDAVGRSDAAWAAALSAGGLDAPSAFVLPDGRRPKLRLALIDLIEEYQRHTGHADLLREAVDGLVGNDPPQ